MKTGVIVGFVILATLLVLGFSFLGNTSQEKSTETIPTGAEEEMEEPAPEDGTPEEPSTPVIKEFTITASNYQFEPNTLNVNQGETIRINLINEQGTHNVFFENYNQKTDISSSPDTKTLEFVADQTGDFAFWCQVSGHRALGMEGTLFVE